MASKRHLESLDPVIFNKLPRLEMEPATSFPASLCKSSPVPNSTSENHFSYKGSYFACPLQSPDGPEQPLARWSPAATYLHYGTSVGSQPVPAEGPLMNCLLYRPESLGPRTQPPGAEKSKNSLMRELLMGREQWASPPPALGRPFLVKKPATVNKGAPLAVPRPVYRAPVCFMDPRMALPLVPRAESLQQRPGDADWALPAAALPSYPVPNGEPHGSTGLRKRGSYSDPGLPLLHSSLALPTKEKVGSPVAFSPYYAAFENYRGPPGPCFLEATCPTTHSQRKVSEVPSLSPEPWPKLQPPPTSPAYQERPPVPYPHTRHPLPLHKAAVLYHPLAPPGEAQPGSLPTAYKGFGFAGSGEPYPGSYLNPQAPRSYLPSPSDTYMPRAAGMAAALPTKPVALPLDAEPRWRTGYLPSPGFTFSPGDAAVFGTSFTSTEPGCEQHQADSPQQQSVVRHSSAFQPICTSEKVPEGSGGLKEIFLKREGGWVKPSQGEQASPYPGRRRASPTLQETTCGEPPAPIIVGKGDACKVMDADKELVPPPSTSSEGLKDLRDTEVSPSSPPMPVINNVFSLAPYQDYLAGNKGLAQVPFCREHLRGDTPCAQNTGDSVEPTAFRDISDTCSPLPVEMAAGQELKADSSVVQSPRKSSYTGVPEKPKLVPADRGSQEDSPGGVESGDLAPDNMVLDLSLKNKLEKVGKAQEPIGQVEGTPGREDVEKEKEGAEGKVEMREGAKPQGLPVLLEVGSGDQSKFQSSATFMFKKFKMLRSVPPRSVPPPRPPSSPRNPWPSPPPPAPSSSTLPASWTPPASPPASSPPALQPSPPALQPSPQPSTSALRGARPALLLLPLPQGPRALAEEGMLLPRQCEAPVLQPPSAGQYFTTMHAWLCDVISCSVSKSSPELLREWLKKVEPMEELTEMPKSPSKPKNGSRFPEAQKSTKGKEIWLAFQDVAALLANLLSQLETFMFARKCPFPHVVRAGAVFIPIHVVKEKLFPKLPGASVDQVLQEHKVELRPTTLSEERHLRDLELKSCTSRMLKLLALKQLPDIYPDLLNLHWHNSIRQQLGSGSQAGQHPSK
ncbi:uncharacterized protein C15orf39 homolog isoform X2 [Colius striatus]|uniref:uncharacterized protein C15orf39 homolog isoform X1 n=1 Tax=Colius striatus TaxID=57412 RepID=UPI002B1D18D9|nr:uncharacterized protein C15orf39 homolog isoform X1 [Colius striatus]XP_061854978.1 uncharacterized protein C15orf39 homolog isoform X2 [Colius striatus]